MKTLVLYYSRSGSNNYLASKIAQDLKADIEPIRPRLNILPAIAFQSFFGLGLGTAGFKHDLVSYDTIVVVGPIMMGQLLAPLKTALRSAHHAGAKVLFATCCGSSDDKQDTTFGYGRVFTKITGSISDKISCTAFPIPLALPETEQSNQESIMKTRLTDEKFTGPILERYQQFIKGLR